MRGTLVGVLVNGMRLLDVQKDAQLIARGALVLLASRSISSWPGAS